MGILSWIILGFVAGLLAEKATGRRSSGCITRVAIGVVGALIGGALANAAGERGVDELSLWSILISFAGASLLLLVFGALNRR
ncbi:MAG TPA: GlsB/YeaQ/YmgE family stress response membrane protein [Acidimicrobiales bacterium]|nr:GlsB/YeaQ/YmgE family stress response membrane protein [Acidimicrobiales bacterium]